MILLWEVYHVYAVQSRTEMRVSVSMILHGIIMSVQTNYFELWDPLCEWNISCSCSPWIQIRFRYFLISMFLNVCFHNKIRHPLDIVFVVLLFSILRIIYSFIMYCSRTVIFFCNVYFKYVVSIIKYASHLLKTNCTSKCSNCLGNIWWQLKGFMWRVYLYAYSKIHFVLLGAKSIINP